jgi:5'-3' exonuclease
LCGCDFNQNIPKIGPKKSFDLIKTYENIDLFPSTINVEILKHKRCREIFGYSPTQVESSSLFLKLLSKDENHKLTQEDAIRLADLNETQALKQREGRYTFLMKGFPEPQSKNYLQMPHIFEKTTEIVFI